MNALRRAVPLAAVLSLLLAAPRPASAQLDVLMQQGGERLNANDPQGAIAPLREGLSIAESRGQQVAIADFAQNLGAAYEYTGQNDLAIDAYEKAIRVYRSLGNKPDLAATLGYLGVVRKNKGENKAALSLLSESLSMFQALGDRAGEGRALANLGNAYSEMSEHAKALDYHQKALSLQSSLGDKAGVAIDLQNITADYQGLGDYPKALEYAARAVSAQREAGDKVGEAGTYTNYGTIYLQLGDAPKSIEYYQRAIPMFRELGEKRELAIALTNLSLVYRDLQDLPQALELGAQSLGYAREVGDKAQEGATLGNLGIVHMDLGDFPKALEHFQRSYDLAVAADRKSGQGAALGNMSLIYERLGDFPKALETSRRATRLSEEATDKEGQIVSLNHEGLIHQALGDYAAALAAHAQALALAKSAGLPSDEVETALDAAYLALGDTAKAAALAATAKDDVLSAQVAFVRKQYLPAKSLFSKAAAEGEGRRVADGVVSANIGLCLTLEKLKDLAAARAACEKAIGAIERQRDLLPLPARGNFLAARVAGYPRIEAYEARARVAADAADGFYWAESAKARAFIEEVAARLGSSKAALPAASAASETQVNARVAAAYKQSNAAFERKNTARLAELEKELASALAAREAFVAELRKSAPAYAAVAYPQPIRAAETALAGPELLVEYAVTAEKTLIYAVGADKKAVVHAAAVPRAELKKLVAAFRKPFESPLDASGKFAGAFDAAAGARLYELLLRPVAAAAKGKKLIIVPDEFLGLLPFEALVARPARPKTPQAPASALRYAADEHDIAYAQSATALTQARSAARGEGSSVGLLVVADPVFDKGDSRVAGSGLASYVAKDFVTMGVASTRRGAAFERLEETGALAETLKAAFGEDATALTGKEAAKPRLLSEDLARYRHVVFATHGILDGDVPYVGEPALVLTQVGNAEGDDGFLKMSDIMGLKLGCEVVALTACKTGLGREVGGEGVVGLGRAFQYAGAKNALVSLWSVSEKSTTDMTAAFFLALKEGKTPREALKSARARLRQGAYAHPFFWAPFVLVGA